MDIHYITEENYLEAFQATRDILFLYHDAITSYAGFGHNLDVGIFDPFKYLCCLVDEPSGISLGVELDLLHEGSTVVLLCHLSDFWDEFEGVDIGKDPLTKKIKEYYQSDGFDWDLLAKETVGLALSDEDAFRDKLSIVYNKYILGYFKKILSEG